MNATQFKAIVAQNGGEAALVSITFDGGSSYTFTREIQYTHAQFLDETNEVLNFTEIDLRGHAFIVTRPVEVVHGMCFATGGYDRTQYDPTALRGLG